MTHSDVHKSDSAYISFFVTAEPNLLASVLCQFCNAENNLHQGIQYNSNSRQTARAVKCSIFTESLLRTKSNFESFQRQVSCKDTQITWFTAG